ncbi:MAG: LLM class flavin-dependent oxidoreductase [Acidobacteria bacterium]|nr:LLM class flavin-dependent oxidoreductase [Acidobacteriota bacterium]
MSSVGNECHRLSALRTGIVIGLPGVRLPESIDLAAQAEAAKLDLVAAGEGVTENFAVVGALAQRTKRVELVTSVVHWTRTPVTFALGASTLAALSGGRFRMGLGTSPRNVSERWYDISYERPVERLRDLAAAIRAAWAASPGSPVSYEGPFYRISSYEHQLPDWAPVPLYFGVTRPGAIELAGEVGDGVVFNLMLSLDWLIGHALPALDRGLVLGGRTRGDIDVGALAIAAVSDDPDEARELARPGIGFYFSVPYLAPLLDFHGFGEELERGSAAWAARDEAGMTAAVTNRMVDALSLAGTPEQIAHKLEHYAEHMDFVELMPPLGHPREVTIEQTQRIIATLAEVKHT